MFNSLDLKKRKNEFRQFAASSSKVSFFVIAFCSIPCISPQAFASNEVVHDGKTYGIADSQYAKLYGGNLVTITDASLNEWLRGTFASTSNYLRIGLEYNTAYGTPETDTSKWRWVGTGSNLPAYNNFALGYPRTGVSGSSDYAIMRTSDGKWLDVYPYQPGVGSAYSGIYETPASAVPITMNLSVHSAAMVGGNGDNQYGNNYSYASYSVSEPNPMNPEEMIFYYADSSISGTGGNWGGRIESRVMIGVLSGQGMQPIDALAETTGTSTITIGTSTDLQAGTPLTLHVDANDAAYAEWSGSFALKRGANTLLSYNGPSETDLLVYAGETLTVEFAQSLESFYSDSANVAVNLWVVVPEPNCWLMIFTAGIFVAVGNLIRKKSILQP